MLVLFNPSDSGRASPSSDLPYALDGVIHNLFEDLIEGLKTSLLEPVQACEQYSVETPIRSSTARFRHKCRGRRPQLVKNPLIREVLTTY